ncbi:hypothetical protein C8J57DRAFT_1014034, partial [Mycena rebaudengoi]
FPPPPLNHTLEERIVRQSCADIVPDKFVEAGCAACGQLTLLTDLQDRSTLTDLNLDILAVDGVTRAERFSLDDPIVSIPGPVMDDSCAGICSPCLKAIYSNKLPLNSLANRMWIGKVPWQLKDLSFAEHMLIAKVRHNRCVVRVNSGRGKLSANAIVFSNPTVQVYNILPPSSDQLSEVLAFVFLGPTRPTDEEFVRTPMLLNHCEYADLCISKENIDALPEYGMPFGVDWKQTSEDESTLSPEQRSVDDGGVDTEGTKTALKAKTLEHLANDGETLGFGHSNTPQSFFNNVQLFPQMFPWLFPYGMGGIGHVDHKRRLSDTARKRLLLMYHDKRFQTDLYFPMVAFNELQIKSGKTGSHLLAKKKHFNTVVDRLAQLDTAVLSDITAQLAAGKKFVPTTESEKACFALLDDLDH